MSAFVLAHLSDPHLAPLPRPQPHELIGKRFFGYVNWTRNRSAVQSGNVLGTLVGDLLAQIPDHIAVTGDLINLSLPAEFGPAREWLETLGEPRDVSLVPGNHDAYVRATRHRFQLDWAEFQRGDDFPPTGPAQFPYLRQRGPLALIGVSTAVPTAPLMATGELGERQLAALDELLGSLAGSHLCRVLLIHHPLASGRDAWQKRLLDAPALLGILRRHGVELVLHGHDHRNSLMWFDGPQGPFPAVGVPSASAGANSHRDPAAYHLFSISFDGAWQIEMTTRGLRRADKAAPDGHAAPKIETLARKHLNHAGAK